MARKNLQATWERRIQRAKDVRAAWAEQFKVEQARAYFEGQQNPGWPENEWITINKIYSTTKAKLPQLYSVDPYFYVKLKRSFSPNPEAIALYEQRGRIRTSYLNYLKGELGLKETARLGILDAQFAYGVLKTHFTADAVDNPDAGGPILDGEDPLLGDDGAALVEPDTLPVNERYNWSRVHPDDFLFDADAGTLPEKWHWQAERFTLTKEQARKDPDILNAALKLVPTTTESAKRKRDEQEGRRGGMTSLDSGAAGDPQDDGEREIYVGWEIYDLENKQWLKIVEGAKRPVMSPRAVPLGVDRSPYSFLSFTPRSNSPYPIPPLSQALDAQSEFNLSRSRILRHRKRFNRKYEVNTQKLVDETEAAKLESGEDGTVIMVNETGAVQPISDAPLDQQTYTEMSMLNRDLVELMGAADNALSRTSIDSATEAALVDNRVEAIEGDDLSLVTDWVSDAAKKMDQVVQAHITRDEAVRVVGPEGERWELVKTEDFEAINGEFDYSVNVGATLPRLPQVERAQFMAVLQIFGNFPQIMTRPSLIKRILEMHRIDDQAIHQEIVELGKLIAGGQMSAPGQAGSQAGVPEQNPITALLGAALGDQGGVTGGGGTPGIGG